MKKEQGFILPIIIVLAVVALLSTAGYFAYMQYSAPKEQTEITACTTEAKVCPDGSSVSRTGPNCEFAECPEVPDPTAGWINCNNNKYSFSIKLPQSLFEGCFINEYNLTDSPGFEYRIEFASKNAGPERFGIAVATKQVDVNSNYKFLGQQNSRFFYIDAWGCCAEGNSPDIKDLILNKIAPTFKFIK